MESKILENIKEIIHPIELLEGKMIELKDLKKKMAWDDYEKAHVEVLDGIESGLELLNETIEYLNENADNLTWDTFDKLYEVLIDCQTYLVEKQAEFSSDILQGYSKQLERFELESDEGNILLNVAQNLGSILWDGVKKSATYIWENKGELHDQMMEKGAEVQDGIRRGKSKMESLVDRQSVEEVTRNVEKIYQKHQSGETISIEDEFYLRAAKRKIQNEGKEKPHR